MKKVTSVDVAKAAGVSQSTVSSVFSPNGNIRVSAATREKVLAVAQQMGYSRPERSPMARMNGLVAVLVPTLHNSFYPIILSYLSIALQEHKADIVLYCTHRDPALEADALQQIQKRKITRVIYTFTPSQTGMVEALGETGTVVIIGEADCANCITVALNSFGAGYMVAEYLYRLGHRDITYVSGDIHRVSESRRHRLEGVRKYLQEKNAVDRFRHLSYPQSDDADDLQIGYVTVRDMLAQEPPSTAYIGMNDTTALGIINAVREHGFSIPGDISVVGFDNIDISGIFTTSLTTVDHCIAARVRQAVDILAYGTYTTRITYEPQLVVRESSGPNLRP